MTGLRTYLDHNATAPLRPEARAAMLAAFDLVGNASSVHTEGRQARETVECARDAVAALVGAKPEEVVFTSGATEANNWAIHGGWDTLIVGATEHESVLVPARAASPGLPTLSCDMNGLIDLSALPMRFPSPVLPKANHSLDAGEVARSAGGGGGPRAQRSAQSPPLPVPPPQGRRGENTRDVARNVTRSLLSLQLANAETGAVQPVARASALARERGVVVHCDAVQAVGRIAVDVVALGVDLMSISAHKIGGPKGVGALVIRDGIALATFVTGGGQERRRRAGTENVAAIAGFGAAAQAARAGLADIGHIAVLRDRLEAGVRGITPAAVVLADGAPRLPNTSCIALAGQQAATLLIKLDLAGIAVSAGSACSSGKIGGSHVLAAMGIAKPLADAAIRISLGPTSTDIDVDRFLDAWTTIHRTRHNRRISAATATARTLHEIRTGE